MESTESLSCLICLFTYLINYSESLTYYIPEEQPINTLIGNIALDEGIQARVSESQFKSLSYNILNLEGKYETHFSLDSSTSDLRIKSPLDRETLCEFSTDYICKISIEVSAKSDIENYFQEIKVDILIKDINDHPPIFASAYFAHSLSESEVSGKRIGLDKATDADSFNFTVKHYLLLPDDAPFRVEYEEVDVNPPQGTGSRSLNLVVDGHLDRETADQHILQLVAFDGGDPPLNGSMTINISIEDANDNIPAFNSTVYRVTVNETIALNTSIITVTATDEDLGQNGEVVYSLSNQQAQDIKDKFEINSTSGEIRVVQHLEYTAENVIHVKIIATDRGNRPLSSTCIVEVTVEDSENNPPEIFMTYFEVREYSSVGTTVAHVRVVDTDSERNGLVSCSVTNEFFFLQKSDSNKYRVTVLSTLDRETIPQHNVTVMCHDYGVPRKTSEVSFLVDVVDDNDNAPVFKHSIYETSHKETDEVDRPIILVHAVDKDVGNNGKVSYYLETEYTRNFTINLDSGLITSNIPLDRESKDNYTIVVLAVDAGNPQLSSSAIVILLVEDVNDNAPVFVTDPIQLHVPEGVPKETVLEKIRATDRDTDQNSFVTYSLHGNYTDLPFDVLPDGSVKTKETLDREVTPQFQFTVMAIDNGFDVRLNSTATVIVHVKDVNDNYPEIIYPKDPSLVRYVTYMTPSKTQIMKVEAEDADEGNFGELLYQITNRNDSNIFEIGRNGEIYVARKLEESDINLYKLEVTVLDKGDPPNTAITSFNIEVIAKNVTSVSVTEESNQNVVIVIVVVVVTVIMAILILLIIWAVRRHDQQKRKYAESTNPRHTGDNDSGFSSTGDRKSPDGVKMFESSMLPTAPPLIPISAPTVPTNHGNKDRPDGGKTSKDVKFQEEIHVREKSLDSVAEQSSVQLHRLASLRLHQALIQNNTKPWTSQSSELDGQKEARRQEDLHSDLSVDTATYDSGIGGSVSDTGDMRLMQLQQIVRQSGRRGKPPHKSLGGSHSNGNSPSKPARIITARCHMDNNNTLQDTPPERPPPMKHNPYTSKSPVQNHVHYSPSSSPTKFVTSSPTPLSPSQLQFQSPSPTKMNSNHMMNNNSPCHSPSRSVVNDLLMYKRFQNGLKPSSLARMVDESVDTTQFDDDDSTTSGSYYIDQPMDSLQHPPVSDIYV